MDDKDLELGDLTELVSEAVNDIGEGILAQWKKHQNDSAENRSLMGIAQLIALQAYFKAGITIHDENTQGSIDELSENVANFLRKNKGMEPQ